MIIGSFGASAVLICGVIPHIPSPQREGTKVKPCSKLRGIIKFKTIADILGKKIYFVPFPISYMGPYAYLTNLLTPVPGPIVQALLRGIKNKVVCQNDEIRRFIPFRPLSLKEAILRAMTREEQDNVHTRWSDAYPPAHALAMKLHEVQISPRYTSNCSLFADKTPSSLFHSVCKIGGKEGWFRNNWMWRLRVSCHF